MAGRPKRWVVKPASARAKKEWEGAKIREPDLIAAELERLTHRPLERGNPRRTGPLKGSLARRRVGDQRLPQWQHELTGAGRLWCCVDKDARIIWVTKVSLSHPKETD